MGAWISGFVEAGECLVLTWTSPQPRSPSHRFSSRCRQRAQLPPPPLNLAKRAASLFPGLILARIVSSLCADSESSSVRRLDLASGGSRLLVGGDPMFSDNLFRFGDKVKQLLCIPVCRYRCCL